MAQLDLGLLHKHVMKLEKITDKMKFYLGIDIKPSKMEQLEYYKGGCNSFCVSNEGKDMFVVNNSNQILEF